MRYFCDARDAGANDVLGADICICLTTLADASLNIHLFASEETEPPSRGIKSGQG